MSTIKVSGGVVFEVLAESDHFIICRATGGHDLSSQEILDSIEDMYIKGYRLCTVRSAFDHSTRAIFEKVGGGIPPSI